MARTRKYSRHSKRNGVKKNRKYSKRVKRTRSRRGGIIPFSFSNMRSTLEIPDCGKENSNAYLTINGDINSSIKSKEKRDKFIVPLRKYFVNGEQYANYYELNCSNLRSGLGIWKNDKNNLINDYKLGAPRGSNDMPRVIDYLAIRSHESIGLPGLPQRNDVPFVPESSSSSATFLNTTFSSNPFKK